MIYHLSETEMAQIKTLKEQIYSQYCKEDASRLEKVIERVLQRDFIDESDLYELIDVLPRILPRQIYEPQETQEEVTNDWNGYIDERRAKYKREMEKLYQVLSSWVFMQNAIYRRNMKPLTSTLDKDKFKGDNQGIKK